MFHMPHSCPLRETPLVTYPAETRAARSTEEGDGHQRGDADLLPGIEERV